MSQRGMLKDRAAGRWQVPLFVLSMVLLTASVYRAHVRPAQLPAAQALAYLDVLVSEGSFGEARALGESLLRRPGITAAEEGLIHLALARAGYGLTTSAIGGFGYAEPARQIVGHYERAVFRRQRLTRDDHEHYGRVLEWLGRYAEAVQQYRLALGRRSDSDDDLRQHVLSLSIAHLAPTSERLGAELDAFLSQVHDARLDLLMWALERRLQVHEDLGTLEDADGLLQRCRKQFADSTYADRFAYWEAWLLHATGRYAEAERALRALRDRLDTTEEVYAMSGYLLGRVILFDGGPQRPQEAVAFFDDVVRRHPDGAYAVLSRVGRAEALAMLERHDEALEAFRGAMESLVSAGADQLLLPREGLQALLGVTAQRQRHAGRLSEAVAYAELATRLIDESDVERATLLLEQYAQFQAEYATVLMQSNRVRPGRMADRRADEIRVRGGAAEGDESPSRAEAPKAPGGGESDTGEAAIHFASAAETYLKVARLNSFNERLAGEARWRAAELFARAGATDRAITLFQAFLTERPEDPLVPRALLRVGQLYQRAGDCPRAVQTYQECFQRFPRTLEASQALIPLARCYAAMGEPYGDVAAKTLRIVLEESEVFTPEAPEFADALFLLGKLQNRRGDFEQAIATLSEAIERFPNDLRAWEADFTLADSFRRSGLSLKDEAAQAQDVATLERYSALASERLERAAALYRRLIDEYELRSTDALNSRESLLLRLAYVYEADCHFERQDYRQAAALYESAAARYRDLPEALAVYWQIIRAYVALDEPEEARSALARALVLVEAMPEDAFRAALAGENRGVWKRYFQWLAESGLF